VRRPCTAPLSGATGSAQKKAPVQQEGVGAFSSAYGDSSERRKRISAAPRSKLNSDEFAVMIGGNGAPTTPAPLFVDAVICRRGHLWALSFVTVAARRFMRHRGPVTLPGGVAPAWRCHS
jgi:hypothetical protein